MLYPYCFRYGRFPTYIWVQYGTVWIGKISTTTFYLHNVSKATSGQQISLTATPNQGFRIYAPNIPFNTNGKWNHTEPNAVIIGAPVRLQYGSVFIWKRGLTVCSSTKGSSLAKLWAITAHQTRYLHHARHTLDHWVPVSCEKSVHDHTPAGVPISYLSVLSVMGVWWWQDSNWIEQSLCWCRSLWLD